MNKTELTDKLADTTKLSKADAQRAIDALFDTDSGIIAKTLVGGDKVTITGFGTFETRKRSARMGRNPRTGERIHISASITPNFRAGKGLKDTVKESGGM